MIRNRIRTLLSRTPYLWRFKEAFAHRFLGTSTYWEERYRKGGNSGAGSYGHLAQFKADFLNAFVAKHEVKTVIEFGCGDGAQLALATYRTYTGLDVSPVAVKMCISKFARDRSKSFFLYDGDCFLDNRGIYSAEVSLSLDVIYHLIEERVFERYMHHLFGAATRFVIVYSSNHDEIIANTHVRHRKFSDYVTAHFPEYSLIQRVEQRYPIKTHPENGSFADFYVYGNKAISA